MSAGGGYAGLDTEDGEREAASALRCTDVETPDREGEQLNNRKIKFHFKKISAALVSYVGIVYLLKFAMITCKTLLKACYFR